MDITIGLIIYEYVDKLNERIKEVVLPTINYYKNLTFEVIIIDNSKESKFKNIEMDYPFTYHWNNGENTCYAGAVNQIIQMANAPILLYICAHHGRINDITWLEDLLKPLENNVAMSGDRHYADGGCHIQGGIFAAQIKILKNVPYSNQWPHLFSDIHIGKDLQDAGFEIAHVPTIRSVWRVTECQPEYYKYIHDGPFIV